MAVPLFPIISSVQSKEAPDRPCYGVSQTCPDVLRRRFRGFCTVFGFSLFGRVGVYSGISQWYRVGDAGALRAGRALSHPLSCAVKKSNVRKRYERETLNSLARHWARDWRALALTRVRKRILQPTPSHDAQRPPIPEKRSDFRTTILVLQLGVGHNPCS